MKTAEEALQCRTRFQALNDSFWTAECDQSLTYRYSTLDERAFFYGEENLALRKEIGDLDGEGLGSNILGYLELCRGNADRSLELNLRSLACFETVGNREAVAFALDALAMFYIIKGDYQEALRQSELLLRIAQGINDQYFLCSSLLRRAYIAWAIKEYDQTIRNSEQVLEMGRDLGRTDLSNFAFYLLCRTYLSRGEVIQARSYLKRLFNREFFWGRWGAGYRAIQTLGLVAVQEGQMQQAAIWFGAQDGQNGKHPWLLENLSLPERSEYEQALAAARAALGDEAFDAALEAGRTMTAEQIIHSAMEATGEKG